MTDTDPHPVRSLGPTAWAVLELLRERGTVDDGGKLVADAAIRSIAVELGLAKNTIHRAMRRLRGHGLIDVHQTRTSAGTFGHGSYVLVGDAVAADGHVSVASSTSIAACPIPASPRPVTDDFIGQLTLGI